MQVDKKVFKAVVGSVNYNLTTPTSDVDKKLFMFPTFEEMYKGNQKSKVKTSDTEDVEVHDIRKLPQMLWKSNVNFIEVLFSQHLSTYPYTWGAYGLMEELESRREDIARMNLPYLFDACFGMFLRKKKDFDRDKIFTLPDEIDKARAGLKHAHSAIRIADFIDRYRRNSFDDFGGAIRYRDSEPMRDILMQLKLGTFSGSPAGLIEQSEARMKANEQYYKDKAKDEELNEWLQKEVFYAVRHNITRELRGL